MDAADLFKIVSLSQFIVTDLILSCVCLNSGRLNVKGENKLTAHLLIETCQPHLLANNFCFSHWLISAKKFEIKVYSKSTSLVLHCNNKKKLIKVPLLSLFECTTTILPPQRNGKCLRNTPIFEINKTLKNENAHLWHCY